MDFSSLATIHRFAVTFYIGFFALKVFMVLANRHEQLKVFKKKTLILEILLPLIFITSGILMISNSALFHNSKLWFNLKIVGILVGIFSGIIGIKKLNKPLVIFSLLCFLGVYSYTNSEKKEWSGNNRQETKLQDQNINIEKRQ